jgi:DHA2 family lincomycin resistance protein-like MFS transporter
LPYYLQDVLHLDVLYIGGILLPGGLLMGLLGPVVGWLYDKVGPKPLLVPGIIIVSAVLWSATLLSPSTPWQAVLVVYTIMCIGFALLFGPLFTLSLGSIQPQFYSHGSAILGSIQQVAGAAGVALLISLMSATQAGSLAAGAGAEDALSAGIRAAFLVGAIVSLLAVATVFFFKKPDPQPQGNWGGGH